MAQAAALMTFEAIHHLPVVACNQEVVGMLSTLDIARWLAMRHGYLHRLPASGLG